MSFIGRKKDGMFLVFVPAYLLSGENALHLGFQ